jgi:hypothetical protein
MDTIINKIKKLLALSESPNQHEAQLAAQKAQEMLAAHNLTMETVTSNTDAEQLIDKNECKVPITRFTNRLSGVIADAFDCRAILHKRYSRKDEKISFYGYKHNPEVAAYTYQYLLSAAKQQCKAYLHELKHGKPSNYNGMSIEEKFEALINKPDPIKLSSVYLNKKKSAYLEGFIDGVHLKLHDQKKKTPLTPFALVPTMNALIDKRIGSDYKKIKNGRNRTVKVDGNAYHRGSDDGYKTSVHKAVHGEEYKQALIQ